MSNTQPQQPIQQPQPLQPAHAPQQHKQVDNRRTSGIAITGLIIGIVAVVLSFIPIVNNAAPFIAIVGAVFAIIGIVKCGPKGVKKGRVMSIVATILAVLAIVITLVAQQTWSDAFDSATRSADHSAGISTLSDQGNGNKPVVKSVELDATATGKGTAQWMDNSGSNNSQDFNQKWTKQVSPKDAKGTLSLDAMPDLEGPDSQKVSCTIKVNGKVKSHKEATGTSGDASCSIDFDN